MISTLTTTLLSASLLPAALCPAEAATIMAAAERIEEAYVIEQRAAALAADVRALAANASETSTCLDPADFASRMTKALRDTTGDKHFTIDVTREQVDESWLSDWRASGQVTGQGVRRVEVLDGNVGYLRIDSFFEIEAAREHYAAAFAMLADTDALILDLRSNGGGSPQSAWPLQWTFLEPGSPSPMAIENREEGLQMRGEPEVPWKRYGTARPLVVLIDERTFSAAEAVAFTLQATGRATVVGQSSGGGAHMLDNGAVLGTGFTLYTPSARPLHVASGSNWEGAGVQPDRLASGDGAIAAALEILAQ